MANRATMASLTIPAFRIPPNLSRNLTITYIITTGALFGLLSSCLPALQSIYSIKHTISSLIICCLPFGLSCGVILTSCFVPHHKSRWISTFLTSAGLFCVLSGVVLFMPQNHNTHFNSKELLCDESAFRTNASLAERVKSEVPSAGQLVIAGMFLWLVGVMSSVVVVVCIHQEELSSSVGTVSVCVGAILGYVMAGLEENDDRRVFVLGLLLCGTVMFVVGLLFCMVPNLRTREDLTMYEPQVPGNKVNFRETGRLIVGLVRQFMFVNLLAVVLLDMLSFTYVLHSLPSYLQWQFDVSHQVASITTATVFFLPLLAGMGVFPLVLRYLHYSPKNTKKLLITCTAVSGLFAVLLIFTSCSPRKLDHEVSRKYGSPLIITNICNEKCHCSRDGEFFQPVCHQGTQMTFASACHAGCLNWSSLLKRFERCECVKDKFLPDQLEPSQTFLVKGLCQRDCGVEFLAYITLMALMQFFAGFPLSYSLREITRSVGDSAALLLSKKLVLFSVLIMTATTPWLVGMFMDGTCLLWDSHLINQRSNYYRNYCVLHNADRLKSAIHIPLVFIKTLLAALLYMVYRYSIDPDTNADETQPSVQYRPVENSSSVLNLVGEEAAQTESGGK